MTCMDLAARLQKLEADIMAEPDHLHRETLWEGISQVANRELGGCECERRIHAATRLPDDRGEAAKMLLPRVLSDLQTVARFRGNHGPGFAEGLAVIGSTATRLAGECVETPSD
jgi:hypothetical protein